MKLLPNKESTVLPVFYTALLFIVVLLSSCTLMKFPTVSTAERDTTTKITLKEDTMAKNAYKHIIDNGLSGSIAVDSIAKTWDGILNIPYYQANMPYAVPPKPGDTAMIRIDSTNWKQFYLEEKQGKEKAVSDLKMVVSEYRKLSSAMSDLQNRPVPVDTVRIEPRNPVLAASNEDTPSWFTLIQQLMPVLLTFVGVKFLAHKKPADGHT